MSEKPRFTRTRRLSLPLFSLGRTPHLFVRIDGEIREEEMPALSKNEDKNVRVVPVTNLETGEPGMLLLLTMVETSLRRMTDGYVGKCVELENTGKVEGKSHDMVNVYLIECPGPELLDGPVVLTPQ